MSYRYFLNKKSCISFYTIFFLPSPGELIGIEYLYSQTGEGVTDYRGAVRILADDADVEEENPEHSKADEGFHEQQEEMLDPTLPVEFGVDPVELGVDHTSATPALPYVAEYGQMMAQSDPGNTL